MRLIFSLVLGAARMCFTSRASNGALERTAASAALETTRPSSMMGSGLRAVVTRRRRSTRR